MGIPAYPPEEVMRCIVAACSPKTMGELQFLFWSYMSLSLRVFIGGAVFYAIFWGDFATFISLAGTAMVTLLGLMSKLAIRHPRLYPACGVSYGIPSIHAMVVWFLCVYYVMTFTHYSGWGEWTLNSRCLAIIAYGAIVSASRIALRAADELEVFAGALAGSVLGILYLKMCSWFSMAAVPVPMKAD